VALRCHLAGEFRVGGDPASLEKEGGPDAGLRESFQDALTITGAAPTPVRVFGVDGESDHGTWTNGSCVRPIAQF
jgi:hypothetical protein